MSERNRSKSRSKSKEKSKEKEKSIGKEETKTKKNSSSKSSNKENSPAKREKKEREQTKKGKEEVKEKKEKKEKKEEEVKEYEYEDDFEDYSDDFEEDADEESPTTENAVGGSSPLAREDPQPPSNENQMSEDSERVDVGIDEKVGEPVESEETPMMRRLKSSYGQRSQPMERSRERERQNRIPSASQRKMDFSATSSKTPLSYGKTSAQEMRFRRLKDMIGIESSTIRILDNPPVKDYDFYLEMFGNSGRTQAHTQTGEDDICEETQTEEVEEENKWTQHPPQDEFGWGGESGTGGKEMGVEDEDLNIFKENHLQNERLREFLEVAGQVIIDLMSSRHRRGELLEMRNRSLMPFSAGFNTRRMGPVASNVRCNFVLKPSHDVDVLLCAFFILESAAEDLVQKSLLVEFFLNREGPPQRLFICESEVRCCVYSPDGSILFAGLNDGSCVAWDLLESSVSFKDSLPWLDAKEDLTLRTPAYETAFLSSTFSDSHRSAATVHLSIICKDKDSAYQVASVDESGTVSIWSVLRDANTAANLGVRPEARLAMGLTALLRPDKAVLSGSSTPTFLIANCMASNPLDPQQFIIGTDNGFLVSMSRTKGSVYAGPRLYKSKMHVYGEIVSVKFSPFDPELFIAGLSTGCISVHRIGQIGPLLVLTPPHSSRRQVICLEWSPSHPSVFYSIHDSNRLLTWDVGMGRSPLGVCELQKQVPDRVMCSCSWLEKTSKGENGGISYLVGIVRLESDTAIGLLNGEVQIHALEPLKSRQMGEMSLAQIIRNMESGIGG